MSERSIYLYNLVGANFAYFKEPTYIIIVVYSSLGTDIVVRIPHEAIITNTPSYVGRYHHAGTHWYII